MWRFYHRERGHFGAKRDRQVRQGQTQQARAPFGSPAGRCEFSTGLSSLDSCIDMGTCRIFTNLRLLDYIGRVPAF